MKDIFLLLFFPAVLFSQVKGVITDSISGKPVPFATIAIENEKKGTTAEENGQFLLEENTNGKMLVVSALGFETKKIAAENAAAIQLQAVIYQLDNITVASRKNDKNLVIGGYIKEDFIQPGWSWPTLFAKKFPYEAAYEQTPFIKNGIIYTDNSHKTATIKLRVFKVGPDGFPGEDLINEDIIVTVKRGGRKTIVDLAKYNLEMPKEGIFFAFEWMLVNSNKYKDHYKDHSGKRHNITAYEPTVLGNRTNTHNAYFREGVGKWYERPLLLADKTFVGTMEPAINLTLTN